MKVDFWRAALAGFASGFVTALGACWMEMVLSVVRLDFGHTGMRYVGGERQSSWLAGIFFHLVDSILLGLAYAALAVLSLGLHIVCGSLLRLIYIPRDSKRNRKRDKNEPLRRWSMFLLDHALH